MLEYNGKPYRELRCRNCRALLAEEYVYCGRLRIKCRKCKHMNTVNFKASTKFLEKMVSEEQKKPVNKLRKKQNV